MFCKYACPAGLFLAAALLAFPAYAADDKDFHIESSAFAHESPIPSLYTCEGKDMAPPVSWSDVPTGTKSLVLIVYDPDYPDPSKPISPFVLWTIYNIPATAVDLQEGGDALPFTAREGVTNWKHNSYGGPCPPIGRHRYFFKLYALDGVLGFKQPPTKADLEATMKGHILGETQLIGTYQKNSSNLLDKIR